jgi:alkylation response protein AidB-like acyl-CoA dehydrogenase
MRSIVLLPGPDPEGGDPAAKFHARLVHFPLDRPEVNVERTWDAAGLRASQTDTVAVEGLRIPRSHAIHGQSDEVRDEPARRPRSAHYAQPGWALSNARIGLALAGCAAEAFDLAVAHTTGGRANQGGAPARFPGVRYAMAEAFVELQAARMAQYGVAAAADARAQAAVNPTAADVLQVLATGMASTQTVLRAIDQLSLALGATGTQRALPFERLFRDIRTGALHLGVHPSLVRERVAGYLFPGPG